ncbi:hypothetical protein HMPREF0476_0366 [Kingella kingae ATCC 23330]|uniref:Uncharacterized protein n=1 Tax=Kingella kingae ATCC 23330 TaxID=887327 RepID=F5S583_KINKI|nr:hypothetical protein HMPREF0476_0366 [Kingella kingae ATCC 23330]
MIFNCRLLLANINPNKLFDSSGSLFYFALKFITLALNIKKTKNKH